MTEQESLEYVGFWARVGASIIDTLLMMLIIVPLLLTFYGRDYFLQDQLLAGPADFVINYILPAIAVIAFWVARGATPGKMVIGAKIVDARTGCVPSLGQCIGRYLGYFVSSIPLFLGLIWVGISAKKQGWHDMMAGTVVVRNTNRGTEPVRFG